MNEKVAQGERAMVVAALLLLLPSFSIMASASGSVDRPDALPYIDPLDCIEANGTGACDGNDTAQWEHTATIHEHNSSIGPTEATIKLRIEGKGNPVIRPYGQQTILLIDDSGSMTWNDLNNKRIDAAKYYADLLSFPDELGVAFYADTLPSGNTSDLRSPLTNDYQTTKAGMYATSNGGTPAGDGMKTANDELIPKKKTGYTWTIIQFTDGYWNSGSDLKIQMDRMIQEHVRLYIMGLPGDSKDEQGFINYTKQTGGKYYGLKNVTDIYRAYQDISFYTGGNTSWDLAGTPPKSSEPMVVFKLTDDIEVVPGSFVCGAGCIDPTPTSPSKIDGNNSGLKLEWKAPVKEMKIKEKWEVTFKVRSYTVGTKVAVNDVSKSYIAYDQYNGTPGGMDRFDQLRLKVLPSVPTAPTGLKGELNDTKIDLSWSSPSQFGGPRAPILSYKIYRGVAPGGEQYLASTSGTETKFVDVRVSAKNTYYYRVSAVNYVGEGPMSDEVNVTVPISILLPGPPEDVSASPDGSTIVVTWQQPSKQGCGSITSYRIYRGTNPGDTSSYARVGGAETQFIDDSVSPGIAYYYRVSALNINGEGRPSEEVNAAVPRDDPESSHHLYAIYITIKDSVTFEPIAYATIHVSFNKETVFADEWGHALVSNAPQGKRRLAVSADGYESIVEYVTVESSDVDITFYMDKKTESDAGVRPPPQEDPLTLTVLVLGVLLAEVAFILIAYTRLKRNARRKISRRK